MPADITNYGTLKVSIFVFQQYESLLYSLVGLAWLFCAVLHGLGLMHCSWGRVFD